MEHEEEEGAGFRIIPSGTQINTAIDFLRRCGQLPVYALDLRELLNLSRSRVTRSLTAEECQTYFQSETCPLCSARIQWMV